MNNFFSAKKILSLLIVLIVGIVLFFIFWVAIENSKISAFVLSFIFVCLIAFILVNFEETKKIVEKYEKFFSIFVILGITISLFVFFVQKSWEEINIERQIKMENEYNLGIAEVFLTDTEQNFLHWHSFSIFYYRQNWGYIIDKFQGYSEEKRKQCTNAYLSALYGMEVTNNMNGARNFMPLLFDKAEIKEKISENIKNIKKLLLSIKNDCP